MNRRERELIEHTIESIGLSVADSPESRAPNPDSGRPAAWTLGGREGASGGIAADIVTMRALGAEACAIATFEQAGAPAWTPLASFRAQWKAQRDRLAPSALKLGPCGLPTAIRFLDERFAEMEIPLILHPRFSQFEPSPDGLDLYLGRLLPHADTLVLSPADAEFLLGRSLSTPSEIADAATSLQALGPRAVLIHDAAGTGTLTQDFWSNSVEQLWLTSPRLGAARAETATDILSAALTAIRALGFHELDALVLARTFMQQAFGGDAPARPATRAQALAWPEQPGCLPWLSPSSAAGRQRPSFPAMEPSAQIAAASSPGEAEDALARGIADVLLDPSEADESELEDLVASAVNAARRRSGRLLVQNNWEIALSAGAYGVVLDQQALDDADLARLAASGLRLGIRAHSYTELSRALSVQPSLILLGAFLAGDGVAPTLPVLGPTLFARMRKTIPGPVIAFGGIAPDHSGAARKAGADGVLINVRPPAATA